MVFPSLIPRSGSGASASVAPEGEPVQAVGNVLLEGFALMPATADRHPPCDPSPVPPDVGSIRATHQTQLLHRLTLEALGLTRTGAQGHRHFDGGDESWLGLDAYEAVLGRVLVNAVIVSPKSVFGAYFGALRGLRWGEGGVGREAALESVLAVAAGEGVDRRDANQHFEGRCATSGAALYRLTAKVRQSYHCIFDGLGQCSFARAGEKRHAFTILCT